MKLHHKILTICVATMLPASALAKINMEKYYSEITAMSIDENLQHPEVPKRQQEAAKNQMASLAAQLDSLGFRTDLTEREGLVLMVTIPAADFFAPNDTVLKTSSKDRLLDIAQYLSVTPDRYKLLVTVHSDDTGAKEYLYNHTRARAEEIERWFVSHGMNSRSIVSYGVGYDEPLNEHQTRKGRAANRRIELYFVPGPGMLEEIKSGKL